MLVGGSAAGLVLGPKLLGGEKKDSAKTASSATAAGGEEEAGPIISVRFEPIVIDVRDSQNRVHHLKVGLAAELSDQVAKDEFDSVMPRGREAALTYLRALSFEEVSRPERYEKIRQELGERVTKAVGERRVKRMLIIDFVAQ